MAVAIIEKFLSLRRNGKRGDTDKPKAVNISKNDICRIEA